MQDESKNRATEGLGWRWLTQRSLSSETRGAESSKSSSSGTRTEGRRKGRLSWSRRMKSERGLASKSEMDGKEADVVVEEADDSGEGETRGMR